MEDVYASILYDGELQAFLMIDVTPLSNRHLRLQKRGVDVHNFFLPAGYKETYMIHVKQHHHEATEFQYNLSDLITTCNLWHHLSVGYFVIKTSQG